MREKTRRAAGAITRAWTRTREAGFRTAGSGSSRARPSRSRGGLPWRSRLQLPGAAAAPLAVAAPPSGSVTPAIANGAERPFASELCSVAEEGWEPQAPAVLPSMSTTSDDGVGQLAVSGGALDEAPMQLSFKASIARPLRFLATVPVVAALTLVVSLAVVAPSTSRASESSLSPQPYWRITNEAIPTDVSAGATGLFLLRVDNVGDLQSVAGLPVTVVDRLPPGIVASRAAALHYQSLTLEPGLEWGECSISESGHLVTCTLQSGDTVAPISIAPVSPADISPGFLAPPIGIEFTAEPTAAGVLTAAASVHGGGAPNTASATAAIRALRLGEAAVAPFGVASLHQWSTNPDGTPATQAGSHPDETTTSLIFNSETTEHNHQRSSGVLRDLQIELPPGFVGDPHAAPKCTRADFDVRLVSFNVDCPAESQVGVAAVNLSNDEIAQIPIYNLVPPAGVPAQFGIAFGNIVGFLDANVLLNAHGDYVVTVTSRDIQNNDVVEANASFWGDPALPSHTPLRHIEGLPNTGLGASSHAPLKPFLRLPTSCGVPQTLSVSATSWEGALAPPLTGAESTNEENLPIAMEGCSKLDFSPSLELMPETSATDSPTGIEADLRLPQNEDPNGLAEADLKNASVTLPTGWGLSPAAANGLEACTPEEIGIGDEQQPSCSPASKIGTLEVTTPLLEHPLEGEIYVAQQGTVAGSLLGGYLVVDDARTGVLIKLPGRFEVGGQEGVKGLQPGQIRAVFQNSPQFPFSDLKLKFFGGAHAALMTPQSCGSSSASTEFTGWNGAIAEPESNAITTNTGCDPANTPAFTAGTASGQAGAYSPFSLTLSRDEGTQRFGAVSVTEPPGLLGNLTGVSRCPEADIEAAERLNKPGDGAIEQTTASCPASSEVGTITATGGPGPEPVSVSGREYLAGPYEGAPFSLDAITPAVAGPFDLGVVVVRQGLFIDRTTGQATVKSDPLPTMLQGVPLDLRSVTVNVTCHDFTLNPTSCGQLAVTGSVTSTEANTVGVSSNFKAAGCSKLPFRPTLSMATGPRATKTDGASLTVKMSQKPGEANLRRLDLQFPVALPSRLTTLQQACTEAQFNSNPAACPKGAVIGTAKAVTPILEKPLQGPMILVSHGGAAFPDLDMVLQGEGVTIVVDGKSDIKKGITYSRFESIPDAPVTSFEATLPTGPDSIFAAYIKRSVNANLCGTAFKVPTTIEGQNGAVIKETSRIGVTGCPKAKAAKKKAKVARHTRQKAHTVTVKTASASSWGFAEIPNELAVFTQRGIDSARRVNS